MARNSNRWGASVRIGTYLRGCFYTRWRKDVGHSTERHGRSAVYGGPQSTGMLHTRKRQSCGRSHRVSHVDTRSLEITGVQLCDRKAADCSM